MVWEPWMTIGALGGLGGFIGSFLPSGMSLPMPPLVKQLLGKHVAWQIVYHLILNTVCGGIAAFLTWGLYSQPSATTIVLSPVNLAGAILTGLGGAAAVASLTASQAKNNIINTMTTTAAELAEDELDKREPPVP